MIETYEKGKNTVSNGITIIRIDVSSENTTEIMLPKKIRLTVTKESSMFQSSFSYYSETKPY